MAPAGVSRPGERLTSGTEVLIRRARRKGRYGYVKDQVTGLLRPPAAAFEPRLPENRPNAKQTDAYLSVNAVSSLSAAGLPRDWQSNTTSFYAAALSVGTCDGLNLLVTWEPVTNSPSSDDDNPHHCGIRGVVEMYYRDRDSYDRTISDLARASEVLPECVQDRI